MALNVATVPYEGCDHEMEEARPAAALSPPFVILTAVKDIKIAPEEAMTSAICWLFKARPTMIPLREVPLTDALRELITRAQESSHSTHIMAFTAMSGLMMLDVRSTGYNVHYEYFTMQWQVLCATAGIKDVIATRVVSQDIFMRIVGIFENWQTWIYPRSQVKKAFLDMATSDIPKTASPLARHVLAHVQMTLKNSGMKSVLLMDAFATTQNKAILLSTVAQQAEALRRAMIELRVQHGAKFPYAKIYPLEGVERLNHWSYPDLYYATISAININKNLDLEGRYMMIDIQTTTPKLVIDKYVETELKTELNLDKATLASLRFLGVEVPRCRRREEKENEEDEPEIPCPRRR